MLKIKELYSKIPSAFKNKYFIITFLFLVWITLLDENNLLLLFKRMNTLEEKKVEIENLIIENLKSRRRIKITHMKIWNQEKRKNIKIQVKKILIGNGVAFSWIRSEPAWSRSNY